MIGQNSNSKHRLVVIGDSLAQGFKNGGIYRSDLSFPALLARCLSSETTFDSPSFTAQTGIPVNLEMIIRGLADEFGPSLGWHNYLPAARYLYSTLKRIKQHWENDANHISRYREIPYHNQAVWGFSANDSWLITESRCRNYIRNNRPAYSVFSVLPDHAMYITGRLVLNPGFRPDFEHHSQIDNVRHLHENGGVENLILCIGHNNIVGALSALKITWSEPDFLTRHHFERDFTVYRPDHFETEMRHLYEKVATLKIPHVFVPTYPYLTIPPVTRGVNSDRRRKHSGYFDYYTRFWIWDEDFDPGKHPHLTREEAIELDQLIDEYNLIIRKLAAEYGFHTVPVHRYVNAVARRRHGTEGVRPFPPDFVAALRRNNATSHLVLPDGKVRLSTDYLRADEETGLIRQGGIFSLDGLHPSTIGYGLIANIYRRSFIEAGIPMEGSIDWDTLIRDETLVSEPPQLLSELRLMLRFLSMDRRERFTRMGQNVLQQLLNLLTRNPPLRRRIFDRSEASR